MLAGAKNQKNKGHRPKPDESHDDEVEDASPKANGEINSSPTNGVEEPDVSPSARPKVDLSAAKRMIRASLNVGRDGKVAGRAVGKSSG